MTPGALRDVLNLTGEKPVSAAGVRRMGPPGPSAVRCDRRGGDLLANPA